MDHSAEHSSRRQRKGGPVPYLFYCVLHFQYIHLNQRRICVFTFNKCLLIFILVVDVLISLPPPYAVRTTTAGRSLVEWKTIFNMFCSHSSSLEHEFVWSHCKKVFVVCQTDLNLVMLGSMNSSYQQWQLMHVASFNITPTCSWHPLHGYFVRWKKEIQKLHSLLRVKEKANEKANICTNVLIWYEKRKQEFVCRED